MFILNFSVGSGSYDCTQNLFNTRPHYVCLLLSWYTVHWKLKYSHTKKKNYVEQSHTFVAAELVKKFPALYGTWKIDYHIHKSLPLIPFLGQMNILITLLAGGGDIEVQGGASAYTTLGFWHIL